MHFFSTSLALACLGTSTFAFYPYKLDTSLEAPQVEHPRAIDYTKRSPFYMLPPGDASARRESGPLTLRFARHAPEVSADRIFGISLELIVLTFKAD